MEFSSRNDVSEYTHHLKEIGFGSRGTCYLRKSDHSVLKIFHDFEFDGDDYETVFTEEEILRFKHIKNDTFIWANDVILLNGTIIGYVVPFVKARNLYKVNPLSVNLDDLTSAIRKTRQDIKTVSENGVATYDVMYNILYNGSLKVIDHDEYSISAKDHSTLEKENRSTFDLELYYFLVDAYFENVVNDNKALSELYAFKKEDVLIFLKLLRARLSELTGNEISTLREALKYINKPKYEPKYQRM